MIKTDSRKVELNDTFVALKGNDLDGHDFIIDAIVNGASKIVTEKDVDINIPKLVVPDTKKWLNNYLKDNYSELINEMNIIGITGTNGKTTTSYLVYQLLNKLGSKTAYIGTIGFYIDKKISDLNNTTPDVLTLYNLLLYARKNNCKNVVMEVSSHSLVEERIYGIKLKLAAFTNLTIDHLDYHKNMLNYLEAKRLILKYLSGLIIVNNDDNYSKYFINKNSKTVGKSNSDYEINTNLDSFKYNNKIYKISPDLKGEYNIYNYVMAISLVHNLGYKLEDIINIKIKPPKGRCEVIKYNNQDVIIDYAHTPDAIEKIIKTFNKDKDVITIIGCGGDRDNKKRPIMGKIATDNSKYVIFTNDNPRYEDQVSIINDILKGVDKDNYIVELDRKEAIIKGLEMLKDEVLLILGKGHEDYQIINGEKLYFDDKELVNYYKKLTKK